MYARKLLTVSLMIAAIFALSFATVPANAQSSSAGNCTDFGYAGPIITAQAAIQAADYTKPNTVGRVLMYFIGLRYQYEDAMPPAGCESAKPIILQFLTVQEDALYATMAAQVDTANKDAYNDIATNVGPARYKTVLAALNTVLGNVSVPSGATPSATLAVIATASAAPQTCSDATFVAQVKTDTSALNGGGTSAAPVIKLRYKYEDLTAPAGCEDGRTILIQSFAITEDIAALSIMAKADSANASTYTDFLNNTVSPRAGSYGKAAIAAFPSLAPTAAATASS